MVQKVYYKGALFENDIFEKSEATIKLLLRNLLRDLALTSVCGEDKWWYTYVLQEDVRLFNEPKDKCEKSSRSKSILSDETLRSLYGSRTITADDCQEISFERFDSEIDLAGWNKILRFRLSKPELDSNHLPEPVNAFLYAAQNIRNELSHVGSQADVRVIFKGLKTIFKTIIKPASSGIFCYVFGQGDYAGVFEAHREQLEILCNDIERYLNRPHITLDDSTPHEIYELYSYTVVPDETIFEPEYTSFLAKLRRIHMVQTVLFETVVDFLAKGRINQNLDDKMRDFYKSVLVDTAEEKGKIAPIHTAKKRVDDGSTRENILHKVMEVKDQQMADAHVKTERICVLTQNEAIARQILQIGAKDVIVARVVPKEKIVVYTDSPVIFTFAPTEKLVSSARNAGLSNAVSERPPAADSTQAHRPAPVQPAVPADAASVAPPTKRLPVKNSNDGDEFYGRADDEQAYSGGLTPKIGSAIRMAGEECRLVDYAPGGDQGGEGRIYQNDQDPDLLVKIYLPEKLTVGRVRKLKAMVAFYEENADSIPSNVCWPEYLVYNKSGTRILGYAMKNARDTYTLEGLVDRLIGGEMDRGSYWSERKNLVQLCETIARTFSALHALGRNEDGKRVLMGDVNPKNILVDKNGGKVWLVDADSYQFMEYNCPVGTEEFTSKRLFKLFQEDKGKNYSNTPRKTVDEQFALASLFFYVLFFRRSPYDSTDISFRENVTKGNFVYHMETDVGRRDYIWQNLTMELRVLFDRTLCSTEIYSPDVWADAFRQLRKDISAAPAGRIRRSNSLFPTCALMTPEQEFSTVKCPGCGQRYEIQKGQEIELNDESYCAHCKGVMQEDLATICRRKCSKCMKLFTVNMWDLEARGAVRDRLCPDCDPRFSYARSNWLEGRNVGDEEGLQQTVSRLTFWALTNLEEF